MVLHSQWCKTSFSRLPPIAEGSVNDEGPINGDALGANVCVTVVQRAIACSPSHKIPPSVLRAISRSFRFGCSQTLSGNVSKLLAEKRQGIRRTSLTWKTQQPGGITHIYTKAAFVDQTFLF